MFNLVSESFHFQVQQQKRLQKAQENLMSEEEKKKRRRLQKVSYCELGTCLLSQVYWY